YAALSVPASDGPSTPAVVSPDILKTYAGTYDFGASLSSRDKQAPIPALAFAGTGLEVAAMDDKVTVRWPIDGGPAEKAGVRAGDLITEIDDVTTKGLDINQVLDKLRGRAGTSVKLKIARKDQDNPIDITIVREPIRLPGARIQVRVEDGRLAVAATGRWSVLDFEKD